MFVGIFVVCADTGFINKSYKFWNNCKSWEQTTHIGLWFEIWDYSWLAWQNVIYSSPDYRVIIWKFCSIWNDASFIASTDHNMDALTTNRDIIDNKKIMWKSIVIWHDVWIWKNAIILKWVVVWTWSVIGAWSVVTKNVPPYAIVAWNPAKVIKYRFDELTIKKLLESEWRNWDIDKIVKNYNLEFLKKSGSKSMHY